MLLEKGELKFSLINYFLCPYSIEDDLLMIISKELFVSSLVIVTIEEVSLTITNRITSTVNPIIFNFNLLEEKIPINFILNWVLYDYYLFTLFNYGVYWLPGCFITKALGTVFQTAYIIFNIIEAQFRELAMSFKIVLFFHFIKQITLLGLYCPFLKIKVICFEASTFVDSLKITLWTIGL
jgi:hypothetical protein